MLLIPFGGVNIQAGATSTTLATTATLLNQFNTATGFNSAGTGIEGDPAVKGDKANNRLLLNTPGVYLVMVDLNGTTDGTQEITMQLRKNGVVVPGARSIKSWTVTINNNHSMHAIVEVLRTDSPGTIATMPAQASTTGPNNTPSFAGAAAAVQTECAVDIVLTSGASTPALTVVDGHFSALRLR